MAKYVVGKEGDIPPSSSKLAHVKGRPIAVFNIAGEYFAIANRCPHQGGSLCHGKLIGLVHSSEPGEYVYEREGEILRCPWHGWEFDLRTGRSVSQPKEFGAKQYDVSVEAGAAADGENVVFAETFEVTVEDKLILVTM